MHAPHQSVINSIMAASFLERNASISCWLCNVVMFDVDSVLPCFFFAGLLCWRCSLPALSPLAVLCSAGGADVGTSAMEHVPPSHSILDRCAVSCLQDDLLLALVRMSVRPSSVKARPACSRPVLNLRLPLSSSSQDRAAEASVHAPFAFFHLPALPAQDRKRL